MKNQIKYYLTGTIIKWIYTFIYANWSISI